MTDRPLIIPAVPTAFAVDGSIDRTATRRLFDVLAASDVDALFVAGTTGEFPALSDDERLNIIRAAVEAAGPDRVIAHVGAPSAYQAARLTRAARKVGATRFAAVTPYYQPASAAGARSYFAAVVDAAAGLPVYAYLFPRLSGTVLTPQETAAIIKEVGLAGAKLTMPGVEFLADLVGRVPDSVELFAGNDALQAVAAAGGRGIVSGVSAACPAYFTGLASAMSAGNSEAVAQQQARVDAAVSAIGPTISGLKAALVEQGMFHTATCRMAIDPPNAEQRSRIASVVEGMAGLRAGG